MYAEIQHKLKSWLSESSHINVKVLTEKNWGLTTGMGLFGQFGYMQSQWWFPSQNFLVFRSSHFFSKASDLLKNQVLTWRLYLAWEYWFSLRLTFITPHYLQYSRDACILLFHMLKELQDWANFLQRKIRWVCVEINSIGTRSEQK